MSLKVRFLSLSTKKVRFKNLSTPKKSAFWIWAPPKFESRYATDLMSFLGSVRAKGFGHKIKKKIPQNLAKFLVGIGNFFWTVLVWLTTVSGAVRRDFRSGLTKCSYPPKIWRFFLSCDKIFGTYRVCHGSPDISPPCFSWVPQADRSWCDNLAVLHKSRYFLLIVESKWINFTNNQ